MVDLLSACQNTASIYKFLNGGDATEILEDIGTSELKAAISISRDISEEADPVHAVNRMLVHLESAYEVLKKSSERILLRPYPGGTSKKQKKINTKINRICIISAICHKYIGSSDKLVAKWLVKKAVLHPSRSNEPISEKYIKRLVSGKSHRKDYLKLYQEKLDDETKEIIDEVEGYSDYARNEMYSSFL